MDGTFHPSLSLTLASPSHVISTTSRRYPTAQYPRLNELLSSDVYNDLHTTGAASIADLGVALSATNDIVEAYNSFYRRLQFVNGLRRCVINSAYAAFFFADAVARAGVNSRRKAAKARARNTVIQAHLDAEASLAAAPVAAAAAQAARKRRCDELAATPSPSREHVREVTGSVGAGLHFNLPFGTSPESFAAAAALAAAPALERMSRRVALHLSKAVLSSSVASGAYARQMARIAALSAASGVDANGAPCVERAYSFANVVLIYRDMGAAWAVGGDMVSGDAPPLFTVFPTHAGAAAPAAYAAAFAAACAERPASRRAVRGAATIVAEPRERLSHRAIAPYLASVRAVAAQSLAVARAAAPVRLPTAAQLLAPPPLRTAAPAQPLRVHCTSSVRGSGAAGASAAPALLAANALREGAVCAAVVDAIERLRGAGITVDAAGAAAAAAALAGASPGPFATRNANALERHAPAVPRQALPSWTPGLLIGRSPRNLFARTTACAPPGRSPEYANAIDAGSRARARRFAAEPAVRELLRFDGAAPVVGCRIPAPIGRGPGRRANGLLRVSIGDRAAASIALQARRIRSVFGTSSAPGVRAGPFAFHRAPAFLRVRVGGAVVVPRSARTRARASVQSATDGVSRAQSATDAASRVADAESASVPAEYASPAAAAAAAAASVQSPGGAAAAAPGALAAAFAVLPSPAPVAAPCRKCGAPRCARGAKCDNQ